MTDREDRDSSTRFVEQFTALTDRDIRRLAMWTQALQGDQPMNGREWRSAASREFNTVSRHPAAVAYDEALESAKTALDQDARAALSLDDLLTRLGEAATVRQVTPTFAWPGRRRALWSNRFGLVAIIGCVAFLAAAIGVGLGGRDDLLAVMGLIAFGLAALAFIPYVMGPLSPPTELEARAALIVPIIATALEDRLSPIAYQRLIEPWRRAIETDPAVDPPMRWRTAVLAGRLGIVVMTGGIMALFSAGWLQQLAAR
jgi:hypothetical protein